MMYSYKDFETGKVKRTRGKFDCWRRGGPLNVWGVIFKNPRSFLFVPEYCLTEETKNKIPPKFCEENDCQETNTLRCVGGFHNDNDEWIEDVFYYCGDHAVENGFCCGCGIFSEGFESFDFIHPGLCDICYDEVMANDIEVTTEDYHPDFGY